MKKSLFLLLICALCLSLFAMASASAAAGITGTLFFDANGNGMMEDSENPIANAEVALLEASGGQETVTASTSSNEQGQFAFPSLKAGSYAVRVLLPKNQVPTTPADGGSQALPGNGQSAQTPAFAIRDGETANVLIGSTKKTGFIKVIAFGDENANSGRFSTEPLLANVLIEAVYEKDGIQYVVATATTNKDGEATLRNLTPATYRVAATLPEPYIVGPVGNKISLFYNCIVPNDDSRGLSEPIRVAAGGSVGMGVGGVLTGKALGKVWLDKNSNGKMDADEAGADGVKIQLSSPEKGVDRSMITGKDGAYAFDKLQAGTYRLTAELPENAMFTLPGDSLLSGSKQTDSADISISLGQTTNVKPIGISPLTSLEFLAFHDQNANGIRDDGEPAFAGANVEVTPAAGETVKGVTDANGLAVFSPIRPGKLAIRATLPDQQVFTVHHEAGSLFATATATNTANADYMLEPGAQAQVQAGVTLPASIAGTVFDDANLSGVFDAGENHIEGIKVEAVNAGGETVAAATTNADGAYALQGLLPGAYTVRFHIVSPYIFSNASSTGAETENKVISQTPAYGDTAPIAVNPGETARHIDAGIFRSAIINGKVLLGDQNDGFSGSIGGLAGVKVSLLDKDGASVSDYTVAETDGSGAFSLKGALPDTYKLQYTLPDGTAFSKPMQEESVYVTEAFTVKSSDVLDTEPLFAVRTASISGTVYSDLNADGQQGESESAIANASIKLITSDGVAMEATSDENGMYRFAVLRPGSYTYEITLPEGNLIMKANGLPIEAGQKNTASCPLTLKMGEQLEKMDVSASPVAQLHLSAFYDNDLSATLTDVDTPYPAATITLTHELTGATFPVTLDENGTATLDNIYNGRYTFALTLPEDHAVTAPGCEQSASEWKGSVTVEGSGTPLSIALVQYGSISGSVWNMDGSSDNIANVPVSLLNADTGKQAANAATGADGTFTFTKLLPGSYILSARVASGFRFARSVDTQVRPSVIVSDSSTASERGQSEPLTLTMGQHLTGQDIGIGATGKLGDFVWLDLDGDGMQDVDEPGIPGITIRLYRYGETAAEVTTDAYGRYLIGDLYPGEYTVEVVIPAELKSTKQQTTFPLVASVLPEGQTGTARADGIVVPSKSRNLNCDLGFILITPGKYPANLRNLPSKDWTPLVPYTPTR